MKALVTVKEFLENGGEIKPPIPRQLFLQNGIKWNVFDSDMYKSCIEDYPEDYYVEIEVTPIYK